MRVYTHALFIPQALDVLICSNGNWLLHNTSPEMLE